MSDDGVRIIHRAEADAEIERLRAREAALVEIAEAAIHNVWYRHTMKSEIKGEPHLITWYCKQCMYQFWSAEDEQHAPDCLVTKARALLAGE